MTMKFNKPIALLLAVTMAMLLSFPSREIIGLGLTADASAITPEAPTLTIGVYNLDGDDTTADAVYEISTREELYWFAGLVNGTLENVTQNTSANAVLTASITVNTGDVAGSAGTPEVSWVNWTPIGNDRNPYTGKFDGRNHTISGLYFNHEGTEYGGLFGYMESGGSVSNVGVINSYINGGGYAGGVCGEIYKGTITNCYNSGTVSSNGWYVGGLCGKNDGTITNCYNTGAVSGDDYSYYVGGLCGYNFTYGIITNCYNTGAVNGGDNGDNVGGLCGSNENIITNCYNTGTVSGSGSYVGGVCGDKGSNDTVDNCYYLDTCAADGTIFKNSYGTSTATEKIASGEVAYLLSQGCTIEETDYPGDVWGQKLSGDEPDPLPLLYNGQYTVYSGNVYHNHNTHITAENCPYCNWPGEEPEKNEEYKYKISNAAELYWFANKVNDDNENYGGANAVLTANITVNSGVLDAEGTLTSGDFTNWTPIGSSSNPYTGTFDGQGYSISGLYFSDENADYVGLFGYVGSGGKVSNVGVVGSYFSGRQNVGGVCGYNYGGTISSCYSIGAVSGGHRVGGVCGYLRGYNYCGGIITNCYNTGAVSGRNIDIGDGSNVGGICGYTGNYNAITNCYNIGTVSGPDSYVGGLCGDVYNNTIDNCYFNSEVYSGKAVGGIESKPIGTNVLGKENSSFKCGEVAYLLSKGCTIDGTTYSGSAWGQRLTGGNKEVSPVITSESAKTVYKVTFAINGNAEYAVKYANPSGIYEMPTAPTAIEGYAFYKWSKTNAADGGEFTDTTAVAGDITVYAVNEEKYGANETEKTVTATCGTEATQDLSAYTVFAAGTPSIGKFTYTIENGNTTLGASISGDKLIIPSDAPAGTYTLKIKATEKEPVVSLMSVEFGTEPLTFDVMVNVNQPDPTATPGASPSPSPSASPSPSLSPSPSASPSPSTTVSPTETPDASPTVGPTATPSASTTVSPTETPDASPTVGPTATPGASPTAGPTETPSASPMAGPTETPSASPTAGPTETPSASPTAGPTETPSASPTVSPTATPDASPTAGPTATPSASPTAGPTATPDASPTAGPTDTPSASPTAKPTATPDASPTAGPTAGPTATPDVSPTAEPIETPIPSPTVSQTATPDASPTAGPTATPSASPTAGPTATPSASPTAGPTATPDVSPTAEPIETPIPSPTVLPTATPGASPKVTPTATPKHSGGGTYVKITPTPSPAATSLPAATASPTATPSPFDKPQLDAEHHFAYVHGYPEGDVKPEANITRGEVAAIFYRLLSEESRNMYEATSNSYTDVDSGLWSNEAISTMTKAGIVSGYDDNTFRPENYITRAEFAVIAARFDSMTYDGENKFTDIDGHWASEYINRAAQKGWVSGYEDNTFRPDSLITRAEAISLINHVLGRLPETTDDLIDDMNVWSDNVDTNAWYYITVQEATNGHTYEWKSDNTHEKWTELLRTK